MRLLPAAMTAIAVIWLVVLFAAPTALSQRRFPVATLLVYEAGSHICHQRRERSFQWAGVQMPVCGRCLGLYGAGALGAVASLAMGARRPGALTARRALTIAAVPMLLSLALEWTGIAAGSNVTRLLSSLPLGATLAFLLVNVSTVSTVSTVAGPQR
jgi:uncharacterized membrane protein